jgi:histidine triad (HIT) family protein
MPFQANCIFCLIAQHRAPATIVYEDDATLAFMDIHPFTRGHTLVIPREHVENIFELQDGIGARIIETTHHVAVALRDALMPEGMNVTQANGRAAGQTVFHFHFHLLPRWRGDGRPIPQHSPIQAERTELEAIAALIRAQL